MTRSTTGTAGRQTPSGTVFVVEDNTGRLGYIGNNTPIAGAREVAPGTKLHLEVEDRGNMMVVVSAAVDPA
jgi:hypothetical protein